QSAIVAADKSIQDYLNGTKATSVAAPKADTVKAKKTATVASTKTDTTKTATLSSVAGTDTNKTAKVDTAKNKLNQNPLLRIVQFNQPYQG
ncbi:hypothetical protein ACEV9J_24310, partial [Vibrio parahaemolyticus]